MFSVLLLAAAAAVSPACQKLQYEYADKEYAWAITHDAKQKSLDIDEQYGDRFKITTSRSALEQSDAEYRGKFDTLISLLIANKCTPPDRSPSWFTYSDKNPQRMIPDWEKIKPKQ